RPKPSDWNLVTRKRRLSNSCQRSASSDDITFRSSRPNDSFKSGTVPRRPRRKSRTSPSGHLASSPLSSPPRPAFSPCHMDHPCSDDVRCASLGDGNLFGPQSGINGRSQVESPTSSLAGFLGPPGLLGVGDRVFFGVSPLASPLVFPEVPH
ncbi:hypothetical protein AMTR_s00005p00248760, partial [Amborella trichopoda]